jgi:hypothetical protein
VERIFFIESGKVSILDRRTTWKILSYIEGSYFGDIQVFMGINSNYNYQIDCNEAIIYSLRIEPLFEALESYPKYLIFLKQRAYRRYHYLKKMRS